MPLYTDARLYAEAGIPTIAYGAGPRSFLEANGHRADERLRLSDLDAATSIVALSLADILAAMTYPRDMVGYGRNPPDPQMAGRRARRRAVRHQLRGGRREQHPARRRRLGGVPVGDRRRAALAGPAPHEHGIDLRIRLARRLLAALARVHRRATSRSRSTASRPRIARNPEAVAAMREAEWEIASHGLKWIDYRDFSQGRRARAHARGDPHPHRGDGRAAARLVHGPHLGPHDRSRCRGRRIPLHVRHLCRRPALLAQRARTGRSLPSPTRSTPTTCASPRRRASIPATSSSPI